MQGARRSVTDHDIRKYEMFATSLQTARGMPCEHVCLHMHTGQGCMSASPSLGMLGKASTVQVVSHTVANHNQVFRSKQPF